MLAGALQAAAVNADVVMLDAASETVGGGKDTDADPAGAVHDGPDVIPVCDPPSASTVLDLPPSDSKDPAPPMAANPYTHMFPTVDKVTGQIVYQYNPPQDDKSSECAEPPSPKPEKKKQITRKPGPLIVSPPVLDPTVAHAARDKLPSTQDGNVEAHRHLKKKLDDEAKAQAEEKKQRALEKQQEATQQALAKAKAKYEKALAKAEALSKKDSVKRKLADDFDAAAEEPQSPVIPPAKAPRARSKSSALLKLSPKAKEFAKASVASPSKAKEQRSDNRMKIASDQFTMLRGLALPDLDLPHGETFDKKILACICAYAETEM